jgi:hypothetical protein
MLAKAEAPCLGAMQVMVDGSLQGLVQPESQSQEHQEDEAGVILLAELLALLITFIGETLTLRLVQDAWPEAGLENCNSGDRTTA